MTEIKELDGTASDDGTRPATDGDLAVRVIEPLLPQRIRRPSDLLRFLATLLGLVAVILLALVAKKTLNGLEGDVADGTSRAPFLLSGVAGVLSASAMLGVPIAFAIERVLHRDGLRVAEGLFAAIAAMVLSFVLGEWIVNAGPEDLRLLLTGGRAGVEPVNTLLTPIIAYVTAVRISRRPTWRAALWSAVALNAVALFAGLAATILGIVVSILVGLAVGYATLYGVGSPNTRPRAVRSSACSASWASSPSGPAGLTTTTRAVAATPWNSRTATASTSRSSTGTDRSPGCSTASGGASSSTPRPDARPSARSAPNWNAKPSWRTPRRRRE